MLNISFYYELVNNDMENAEKYCLMACENNRKNAVKTLENYYTTYNYSFKLLKLYTNFKINNNVVDNNIDKKISELVNKILMISVNRSKYYEINLIN